MKELHFVESDGENQFSLIDQMDVQNLSSAYLSVPFIVTMYENDIEVDAIWVTVYTTDFRYESYNRFANRIQRKFMEWYSTYTDISNKTE